MLLVSFIIICGSSSCKENAPITPSTTNSDTTSNVFSKGADISWLPQMEASGYKFYNDLGVEEDCFKILKDHGINAIRLRTWVNHSNDKASGHCNKDETVVMAVRAKNQGSM